MQSLQSGRDENYETWVCERERERDLLLHGMAKEKQCWVGRAVKERVEEWVRNLDPFCCLSE